MTFIGIDLGTSSVKAVLVDDDQTVLATTTCELTVQRPQPLWSEQDPDAWVAAALDALRQLRDAAPAPFRAAAGIGLSGQMHGAVLLDDSDRPLRPCILWNDGRSAQACDDLEQAVPDLRAITGNIAMPGFTAPKLMWVRRHEPEIFRRTRRVLLPKAYLRLVLTGTVAEDMSDASGTLWLDVGRRDWSDAMLQATGLDRSHMPVLVEGTEPAATLRPEIARDLGFSRPPVVAGGAGDNAAGAAGLGAVRAGDAFLSLGTSGVLWRTTAGFEPRTESAVHAFCHCLPGRWHQMSVLLSAASCLRWWSLLCGTREDALLAPLGEQVEGPSDVLFTPYLAGERTPYNDPLMRASFARLGADTDRTRMTQAVLEGVAFAFRDGKEAMERGGEPLAGAMVIGGGSRSQLWVRILADVLNVPLSLAAGGEAGAAFGAARLGRLAVTGEDPDDVCLRPAAGATFAPDPRRVAAYDRQHAAWRRVVDLNRELARPP